MCPSKGKPKHWEDDIQSNSCGPGCAKVVAAKGYEDDERIGASIVRGEAQRAGNIQPGEEEAQRDLINVLYTKVGGNKKDGAGAQ